MTTLNSRLQLALINRKKSRNLIEKGFTLVELMIVIVIVGILSAVALPNFLSQTTKAKVSEASTKLSGLLKEGHAEYQYKSNPIAVQAAMADSITSANSAGNFVYAITGTLGANSAVLPMTATGNANDAELSTKVLSGCVNFTTGKVDINTQLGATAPTCL